jgi:hypothetical protein
MSAQEKDQTETPEQSEEGKAETPEQSEEGKEFELSEEGKAEVERMQDAYDDDRPTVALPGTDNTITGVAINEWLDDDGNPKFGKDEQQKKDEEHKDKQQEDDKQQEGAG